MALKIVQHKLYNNIQSLFIFIYYKKNLMIDFVMSLSILMDRKEDIYDLTLVIINYLIKIVYYKLIKIIINTLDLAKVIINIVVRYYSFSNSIITNWGSLFILKFCLLLYYFLNIKQKLFIAFYP